MYLPAIYITNESGEPITGLTISDLSIYVQNLNTNSRIAVQGLTLSEDSDVQGLYRIGNFPSQYFESYCEIIVMYQDNLIATMSFEQKGTQPLPNKVIIKGYVYDLKGSPVEKAIVKVSSTKPLPKKLTNVVLSGLNAQTYTDKNGYFELEVIGGIEVLVSIPITGFSKTVLLPDTGVINITEL